MDMDLSGKEAAVSQVCYTLPLTQWASRSDRVSSVACGLQVTRTTGKDVANKAEDALEPLII